MKFQVDVPCEVRDAALAPLDVHNTYTDAILEGIFTSETSKECYFEWADQDQAVKMKHSFQGTLHHDFQRTSYALLTELTNQVNMGITSHHLQRKADQHKERRLPTGIKVASYMYT